MNAKVLLAVFKRNFVSYFSNPTGYLFLCMFVLLSTIAAFWPNEFFNTNLASLDQLTKWFPFIMLFFVPAITMGVWADERRQGTDELLLTIPASDFDVVLGKYLSSAAIYTVSLLFSLFCNLIILQFLSTPGPGPDLGLFLGTYFGYWLVGLAMLSVGMVASFLTPNLTVAYLLGAVFNVPLVFAFYSDAILGPDVARAIRHWSVGEQLADFGRGIVSLSGLLYFLALMAVMLYLSMILIGRRHWNKGREGYVMGGHYATRTLALAAAALGLGLLFQGRDLRLDVSSERLSSLSPETVRLLKNLDIKHPVRIEAFISPEVPESYVQTRLDLLSMLRELQARGGGKVQVRLNAADRYSAEAERAEKQYEITPRRVTTLSRGTVSDEQILMGVAFTSGLEKVVIPFVGRGIPVEYELVRSIATVTQQARKKIGVVRTDARLYGQFDFSSMAARSNWPIIDELEKQYEVVEVDPAQPITERFDALLAVQPSSLGPDELNNFIAAVRSGQPTAVFEDPFPAFAASVPGTSAPRQAPGGMNVMMMGGQQQAPPKGDVGALWNLLGIDFSGEQVVWQDYNPYPKFSHFPEEFVFVDSAVGTDDPFNSGDAVSSKLQHMLFPFPGSITKLNASNLGFTPLVRTGDRTGTVAFREIVQMSPFGAMGGLNPRRRQIPANVSYVLAARIRGKVPSAMNMADEKTGQAAPAADGSDAAAQAPATAEKKPAPSPGEPEVNVILVADIDMLHEQFFQLRAEGDIPEAGVSFDFDNVTFVLNTLDELAGDTRFIELRKRRPQHRTLTRIEEQTEAARKKAAKVREDLVAGFEKAKEEEQTRLNERIEKLRQDMQKQQLAAQEVLIRVDMAQTDGERRMQAKLDQLEQERDRKVDQIERELNTQIRRVQDTYKMWAVLLPPIPPLILAGVVFFTRRRQERLGVSRSRLRS
jgi:ABC-2 type transport system permease protein